jgi:UDP-N-acetylmuramoylalanine--D-glutamate ligase
VTMNMRAPLFSTLPRPQAVALAGRHALVLGLGDSGLSAARWIAAQGGRVRVADTRAEPPRRKDYAGELVTGKFRLGLLKDIDLVCLSPGLSLAEPVVMEALARGIPVLGDIELFAWTVRAQRQSKVIALTGTNGKTTVAALTGHLLRAAKIDCEVAGNIGPAALDALLKRASRPPAAWVLELSSYQLETTWSLAPDAAAMLNLSEDHLDRYAGLAEYGAAKARIFYGAGLQVLNRCDSASMAMSLPGRAQVTFGMDAPAMAEDFGLAQGFLVRGAERILAAGELPIHGRHNVSNALAACALAHAAGAPLEALAAGLRSFRGLPHRVQRVAERGGVAWYDDSKGTNVGAAIAALEGMGRKTVLIAGGEGKGQDFAPLAPAVRAHARAVLLIGRDAALIEKALASSGVAAVVPVERCKTLQAAVKRAAALAQKGDAVLLSPACASFDMFRDYAHRGEVFAKAVKDLANG